MKGSVYIPNSELADYIHWQLEIQCEKEKVIFVKWLNRHKKGVLYFVEYTLGISKGGLYKMRVYFKDSETPYHIYFGAKLIFKCYLLKDIERVLEDRVSLYKVRGML